GRPGDLAGKALRPDAGVADWQEERALGGSVEDLPVVVAVEGVLVSAHLLCVRLDGDDVRRTGVVVKESASDVATAVVGFKEARGRHDRVTLVGDAASAVLSPRCGHELHRPSGARGAEPAD